MAGDVAASIRVQALDGTWETIGADRLADIDFSDLTMSANGYGPDKASFSLKRQPGTPWPDVSAFTPVEIEVGGVQVWSGRVIEAPSKAGDSYGISVQCEGLQYNLDDDLYRRQYADITLSDWKDSRQFSDVDLSYRRASGQVTQDDGVLVISWPKGADVQNLQMATVALDLGPEASGSSKHLVVYMEYDWINAGGNGNQCVVGFAGTLAGMAPGGTNTALFNVNNGAATTSGIVTTVISQAEHRFVEIGLQSYAGGALTNAVDTSLRIKTLRVFPYAYGYATARRSFFISSCLRATDVALDAASYATKVSLPSSWQDLGCSPQYDAAVLADDPQFYLHLSESSGIGTAYEVVRGGTYTSAAMPTQSATGGPLQESSPIYANGYADFNGTTQYITGPSQTLYGPQTNAPSSPSWGIICEALVYPTTASGTRQIARQSTGVGSANWFLRQNSGVWEIGAWNGAAYLTATGPSVVANQWHHVVGAIHYGGLYLYINGVQYGGTAISYVNRATSAPIIIGAAEAATELWQGKIARFAIYNGSLDAGFWNNHYKSALERTTRNVHMTSFSIPELKMSNYQTPREAINAVNSYHDWKVGVDARGAFIFQAPSTSPTVEIGDWPGAQFEDASAGSGEDIYNKAVVEASGPDDSQVIVTRTAPLLSSSYMQPITTPAFTNPSFDVDTSGWTATGTTSLARDTGVYASTPASLKWSMNAGALTTTMTGTFKRGLTYQIRFLWRASSTISTSITMQAPDWIGTDTVLPIASIPVGSFSTYSYTFVAPADTTSFTFKLLTSAGNAGKDLYVDSFQVLAATPTVLDRRAMLRTKSIPVNSTQTTASATQLADTFLRGHMVTPFRGSATVDGSGARSAVSGRALHPSELLLEWGNRLRVSHHIDPDTGALGREGQIAEVSYTHATQQASVTLDNRRQNFEAFVSRLAAVTQANVGG